MAGALLGGMLVFAGGAIYAQTAPPSAPQVVPRVTGAASPMGDVPAPALARPRRWAMFRRRRWRARSRMTSG
jgi:cytochrome c-type protein NapB